MSYKDRSNPLVRITRLLDERRQPLSLAEISAETKISYQVVQKIIGNHLDTFECTDMQQNKFYFKPPPPKAGELNEDLFRSRIIELRAAEMSRLKLAVVGSSSPESLSSSSSSSSISHGAADVPNNTIAKGKTAVANNVLNTVISALPEMKVVHVFVFVDHNTVHDVTHFLTALCRDDIHVKYFCNSVANPLRGKHKFPEGALERSTTPDPNSTTTLMTFRIAEASCSAPPSSLFIIATKSRKLDQVGLLLDNKGHIFSFVEDCESLRKALVNI